MSPPRVRPATAADLPRLLAWLPPGADRGLPGPGGGDCWLVAEDPGGADGAGLLACLRVRTAIGLAQPRHWYHVGCVVHAAAELGLFHRLRTLQLGNDLTGASELADIAWRPALDAAGQARALAPLLQAALAWLAADTDEAAEARRAGPATALAADAPPLVVELPGWTDADGRWPFWDGLGRRFYDGDPRAAAQRFGPAWRSHVAALMPRQPVYAAFLPAAAQAAIGRAHPGSAVLAGLLRQAGLRPGAHVTIDQGGPVWTAPRDALGAWAPAAGRAASP